MTKPELIKALTIESARLEDVYDALRVLAAKVDAGGSEFVGVMAAMETVGGAKYIVDTTIDRLEA